ncbi:hypothetical protein Acor_10460 [Acrocarpospora corrugata]|uniref:Uncharacterized protein n=1 Tax=Acrocarpospora corrugata TaxID=35763 RepID=A0A5M3VV64_9ACTN|nr:hypothetical protein [Acrocarpospora corrugata]GER98982.1 hypothetical protein Acor_10460 [Acrocarpospora corrugata]
MDLATAAQLATIGMSLAALGGVALRARSRAGRRLYHVRVRPFPPDDTELNRDNHTIVLEISENPPQDPPKEDI